MNKNIPLGDHFPISLRGYIQAGNEPKFERVFKGLDVPSEWVLVFDAETKTDAAQNLRFGTYQVCKSNVLKEQGIFYEREALSNAEFTKLTDYANLNGLTLRSRAEFVEEIFFGIGYDLGAGIVGFNLPFDISRLAIGHGTAKSRAMHGGFTCQLSSNPIRPYVQIKSLSQKVAFIRFAAPAKQYIPRGMRNRGIAKPVKRGFFCDVKTLAAALTGRSWGLGALSEALKVEHPKLSTEEHGGPLTGEYIGYAVRDTLTTWECFVELRNRYARHGLVQTPYHRIFSEASLGKAYLKEMGIKPWRELQPDFPPALLGTIMSTYYGGRSEVHIRRSIARVIYCDFLSMYPTVCSLMGLWKYAIAEKMAWKDTTNSTNQFLCSVTIDNMQNIEVWQKLCTLVQITPGCDIFPVRSEYGDAHPTIGSNYISSKIPLWFTLADCIASVLRTGKPLKIIRAITFSPVGIQSGLNSIAINGNPKHIVDPSRDDFYKNLIDRRNEVKRKKKDCDEETAVQLEIEQLGIKILTNAIGYGVFVELNVEELNRPKIVKCIRHNGKGFHVSVDKIERPGRYFHPLLGTLITGAARLMLAIAEQLTLDSGLDWAFCDTDSIAIVKPDNLAETEFKSRVGKIQNWFTPLNPYKVKTPLLKIEHGEHTPAYCIALSAKRYALFERDKKGGISIVKASAHGLGHLVAPYRERKAKKISLPKHDLHEIGIELWQYDLWQRIISETLNGNHAHYNPADLEGFDRPAVSRYGVTTPGLLRLCRVYNNSKPYSKQIRPFGFMYTLFVSGTNEPVRAIAPYDRDVLKAAAKCFDRDTGRPIKRCNLKSYLDVLGQYHLHPEAKFVNSAADNRGQTERRHVIVRTINYVGKEAHRWEEQLYLGLTPAAQIQYGAGPEGRQKLFKEIMNAAETYGKQKLAYTANISAKHLSTILKKTAQASSEIMAKLGRAIIILKHEENKKLQHDNRLLNLARRECTRAGLLSFSRKINMNAANLANVLSSARPMGSALSNKLESLFLCKK